MRASFVVVTRNNQGGNVDPYDFDEHRKRFAGWAAATAARASSKCRFSREQGLQLIRESDLSILGLTWEQLPTLPISKLAIANCVARSVSWPQVCWERRVPPSVRE